MPRFPSRVLTFAFLSFLSLLTINPVHAEFKRFGIFLIDTEAPQVILMDGPIDLGTALNFRRALAAAPDAEVLVLNSGGGAVSSGLLIADDVYLKKIDTYIPPGGGCYSACAYIFLAGAERKVVGELGVHQISSPTPDLVNTQISISDIIDVLGRFETPPGVLTVMFRTPPNEMHIFSESEVEEYGINRGFKETAALPETALDNALPPPQEKAPAVPSPSPGDTGKPDRLALFPGLDFYGRDLASIRTDDIDACAWACSDYNGRCMAFTYHTEDLDGARDNCFLKSARGLPDGNRATVSGQFLRKEEAVPDSFSTGVIDPQAALIEDVDFPFGDLAPDPYWFAATVEECRRACLANLQCQAFTFVKAKKACWLKGSVGAPSYMKGAVSGRKETQSFAPDKIIALNP